MVKVKASKAKRKPVSPAKRSRARVELIRVRLAKAAKRRVKPTVRSFASANMDVDPVLNGIAIERTALYASNADARRTITENSARQRELNALAAKRRKELRQMK